MRPIPHFIFCGLLGSALLFATTRAANPSATDAPPPAPTTPSSNPPTPANMAVRFELFVKDTHVSTDFYTRILGFQCDSDTGSYVQMRTGSVRLGICDQSTLTDDHHFSPTALQGQKGVGTEIVLEVENLDAYYEAVQKTGYPIREALIKRPWGLRDFRLVDPDGYYLRLTEKRE